MQSYLSIYPHYLIEQALPSIQYFGTLFLKLKHSSVCVYEILLFLTYIRIIIIEMLYIGPHVLSLDLFQ